MSKNKREWNRLHEDVKLRSDDEVELTNKITGPGGSVRTGESDEESGRHMYPLSDIVVKKDVSWSEAHLEDSEV